MSRILVIDIETMPIKAFVWGLRDQNVGINQIQAIDQFACFAARFTDEKKVHFYSQWEHGKGQLTKALHKLFDEADVVCGWNSKRFDVPWCNRLFIEQGLSKPSPYAQLDLMQVCRQFRVPSLKLDFVSRWLGIGGKLRTGGMDLWMDVMQGDEKAQALMRRYNINDTKITVDVFHALADKGWLRGLPNQAIEGGHVCPSCGSENLQARGWSVTVTRRYQRYQCQKCGTWSQSTTCESGSAELRPAA